MQKMIEIRCLNNRSTKKYPTGTTLSEIIEDQKIKLPHPILGARVNNEIQELSYEIFRPKTIEFFDITNTDGMRMYVRSLFFVLIKAVRELLPEADLRIEHSISKGFYCEIEGLQGQPSLQTVSDIENRMRMIVAQNTPFECHEMLNEEALKIFRENNFSEKYRLFKNSPELYTSVYSLGNQIDYFYGYLIPATGYLTTFDLIKYFDGMLLRVPKAQKPDELEEISDQKQLYQIFREHKKWVKILGVRSIGSINQKVLNNQHSELIKIGEALHEKKLAEIADKIYSQRHQKKLVLISGPSSSGKTTFSKRLAIQLLVAGLKPIQLSLDDYFVNRELTPRDPNGEFDFEALEALDVELFNQNFIDLSEGKTIKIPRFSFKDGKRFYPGDSLKMEKDNVLLVEGIHALNPRLTEKIDNALKYKIYVSALTQASMDGHNRIPTTDNRLIRRIIRDFKYRNYPALETLRRWHSVRRGEDRNIFPFQEEAHVMFNSALIFELGVLKVFAEPLLKAVQQNQREYSEAQRLLKFLSYFQPIPTDEIPPTSILREFLGNSTFEY